MYKSKFEIGEVCFYVNTSFMEDFSFDSYEREDKKEQKEQINNIFNVITEHKITSVTFETDEVGDVNVSYNSIVIDGQNYYSKGSRCKIFEDFAFKTKKAAFDYLLKVVSKRIQEFVDNFDEVKRNIVENNK